MKKCEWTTVVSEFFPTGSRVICDPPPNDTDEDFCVLVEDWDDARAYFEAVGFKLDGKPEFYTGNDNGGFRSYRKGDINLIATTDREFFELFRTATELARRFNLRRKSDRIALFQAVLYGVKANNLEMGV